MQNDLLTDATAAYVAMEDSRYRAEQDLADKYRAFVSEILRLSLAGLAVFSYIYKTGLPPATGFGVTDILALSGIAMFALSAASALFFLYCASEGLRWYIAGLRHASQSSGTTGSIELLDANAVAGINAYLAERMIWVSRCRWSKLAAAILLGGGGIFVALAIIVR